jgi:hypothetical protein
MTAATVEPHKQRGRWLAPLVASAVGLGFAASVYFPGFMSGDSFSQYKQVQGVEALTTIHPVALVYLWRCLDLVLPGPGGLFLFHLVVYWTAVLLFASYVGSGAVGRVAGVVALGLFPPTFIVSLHIWKDASMLVCSLLAVAMLAWHLERPKRWLLLAAGVLLFYALAVRHNAVFGVLPLVFFLATRVAAQRGWTSRARNAGLFVVLAGLMLGGAHIVNTHNVRKFNLSGLLLGWDLSAVSVYSGQLVVPRELFVDPTAPDEVLLGRLKQKFTTSYCYPLFKDKVIHAYVPREARWELARIWARTMLEHSRVYLLHRTIVARRLLGLGKPLCLPFHPWGIDGNEYGFRFVNRDTPMHQAMWSLMSRVCTTHVYRPWVYLLPAVLVSVFVLRRGKAEWANPGLVLALMLSLGAVLSCCSLFVLAPGTEYRYIIWTVAGSLWSLVLFAKHSGRLPGKGNPHDNSR